MKTTATHQGTFVHGRPSSSNEHEQAKQNNVSRGKAEWQKNALRICNQWSEQLSSKGKVYFYNCITEVSQWQKPQEWTLPDLSKKEISNHIRDKKDCDSHAIKRTYTALVQQDKTKIRQHEGKSVSPKRIKFSSEGLKPVNALADVVSDGKLIATSQNVNNYRSTMTHERVDTDVRNCESRGRNAATNSNAALRQLVDGLRRSFGHLLATSSLSVDGAPSYSSSSTDTDLRQIVPMSSIENCTVSNPRYVDSSASKQLSVLPKSCPSTTNTVNQISLSNIPIPPTSSQPKLSSSAQDNRTSLQFEGSGTPLSQLKTPGVNQPKGSLSLASTLSALVNLLSSVATPQQITVTPNANRSPAVGSSASSSCHSSSSSRLTHNLLTSTVSPVVQSPVMHQAVPHQHPSNRLSSRQVSDLILRLDSLVQRNKSISFTSSNSVSNGDQHSSALKMWPVKVTSVGEELADDHARPGLWSHSLSKPIPPNYRENAAWDPSFCVPAGSRVDSTQSHHRNTLSDSHCVETSLSQNQKQSITNLVLALDNAVHTTNSSATQHQTQKAGGGHLDSALRLPQPARETVTMLSNLLQSHLKQLNATTSESKSCAISSRSTCESSATTSTFSTLSVPIVGIPLPPSLPKSPHRTSAFSGSTGTCPISPGFSTIGIPLQSARCGVLKMSICKSEASSITGVECPVHVKPGEQSHKEIASAVSLILDNPEMKKYLDDSLVCKYKQATADSLETEANSEYRKFDRLHSVLYSELSVEMKKLRALLRISEAKLTTHQTKKEALQSLMDMLETRKTLPCVLPEAV